MPALEVKIEMNSLPRAPCFIRRPKFKRTSFRGQEASFGGQIIEADSLPRAPIASSGGQNCNEQTPEDIYST